MTQLMGHKNVFSLIADLLSQTWFSLLADETGDNFKYEQLVITLRGVSDNYDNNAK